MTRPLFNRTTAAQRRQQRADFKAIKLAVANSPTVQEINTRKRGDAARGRAQKKLRRIMTAGHADVHPFSAVELAKILPGELVRLRHLSSQRFQALSQEARDRLRDNLALILVCVSDQKYRAVANFDAPTAL